ncbi:hypothetical protein D3C74_131880 [compost metagenome]
MMRKLTYNECTSLLNSIRESAPGDWTHDLNIVRSGPARLIDRVMIPDGKEIVFFRGDNYASAWPAANWDRFAVTRAPAEVEQMTLF